MKSSPNQITTHNAGWRTQFRFAGNVFWSDVCGHWSVLTRTAHGTRRT